LSPAEFWGANLGRLLCPDVPEGQDPTDVALSRSYWHASKPVRFRLGSGKAASLVQSGSATVMADIRLDHPLPPGLTLKPGTWRTIPNWMAEIIVSPPEPPFLFVIYGKNPNIRDRLRLNTTTDVVEICGAQNLRCRPAVVRKALDAIGDTPPAAWRKAAYLADRRDRNQLAAKRIDDYLAKLAAKHPALFDLLDALPEFGSGDYEATTLVHAVRTKDAARPAVEDLPDAA